MMETRADRLFVRSVRRSIAWGGFVLLWIGLAGFIPEGRGANPEVKTDPAESSEAEKLTEQKVTEHQWGEIEISGLLPEAPTAPGLFGEIQESLMDLVKRLDRAAEDKKLHGLVLKIKSTQIGWGKLNEVRAAIGRVRAAGKKTVAWLETGESMDYLLATACEEVIIPESTALLLVGLRAEVSFFKNLFDKLDLKADVLRVGEYKSAAEPFTRSEMSPAFREEMEAILDGYYGQMLQIVSSDRKITSEEAKSVIDAGPLTAKAALEAKLVDRLEYVDQLESRLKGEAPQGKIKWQRRYGKKKIDTDFSGFGGMVKMMELMMGIEQPQRKTSNPKIAVIYAVGPINTGRSQSGGLGGETMGSDTIIKAIRQAREDSFVKGVVLRVDSPGGSALASDLMWRELELLKKPFVVSMGDTAASGGYYISMGADKIFAEPGTLTGSIGVVGGKIGLQGLFDKIGVNTTVISRGRNSGVMSVSSGFTDSERESMEKLLYDIYGQFTAKAAAGRKMPVEELEKLARGRVYTGTQALQIKLVDEIGTLEDAYNEVKKMAQLESESKIDRLVLPKPTSPFEALFGPLDTEVRQREIRQTAHEVSREMLPELGEMLEQLWIYRLLSREKCLTLLPCQIRIR